MKGGGGSESGERGWGTCDGEGEVEGDGGGEGRLRSSLWVEGWLAMRNGVCGTVGMYA